MSASNIARSAGTQLAFNGVNITEPMQKYIKSITYSEGENRDDKEVVDELQIVVHDRDDVWINSWLSDIIAKMISTVTPPPPQAPPLTRVVNTPAVYRVTAKSGLRIRQGPSTSTARIGLNAFGTNVSVAYVQGNWAKLTGDGWSCMSYLTLVSAGGTTTVAAHAPPPPPPPPDPGFMMSGVILRKNWNSDGRDKLLDCGQFQVDEITYTDDPNIVTIKGIALPRGIGVYSYKKTRTFRSLRLSDIADRIGRECGMAIMYETSKNPAFHTIDQENISDYDFLKRLCAQTGITLKVTNNIFVLYDRDGSGAPLSSLTINRKDGTYKKVKIRTSRSKDDDVKRLEKAIEFTMPGNPDLLSGIKVTLGRFGPWNGVYVIEGTKHTVGNGGYTTMIKLRAA